MECFTKKYQGLADQLDQVLSGSLSTDCPDLIAIGEHFTAQVRLKMMQGLLPSFGHTPPLSEERLLTVDAASRKLGMTKDYLYRHAINSRLRFALPRASYDSPCRVLSGTFGNENLAQAVDMNT